MDPQNEQEGQPSAVDRANNLLGKGASAYRRYKRTKNAIAAARTAFSAARAGLAAAQGAVTAASNPIGVVVLIIVIMSLTLLIVLLGGGGGTTKVDIPSDAEKCEDNNGVCRSITDNCNPDEREDSSFTCSSENKCCIKPLSCAEVNGTCSATGCQSDERQNENANCQSGSEICCVQKGQDNFPRCEFLDTDPARCLSQDFNAIVKGATSSNQIREIYLLFWRNGQSERWRSLIVNNTTYIVTLSNASGVSFGFKDGIILKQFFTRPQISQRHLFSHETGHSIYWRNTQLGNRFDVSGLANQDGDGCYDFQSACGRAGSFVQSYALRYSCQGICYDISHHRESFAEAIGNYQLGSGRSVNYTGFLCARTISDVRNNCINTYNWVKENIFGGYEF